MSKMLLVLMALIAAAEAACIFIAELLERTAVGVAGSHIGRGISDVDVTAGTASGRVADGFFAGAEFANRVGFWLLIPGFLLAAVALVQALRAQHTNPYAHLDEQLDSVGVFLSAARTAARQESASYEEEISTAQLALATLRPQVDALRAQLAPDLRLGTLLAIGGYGLAVLLFIVDRILK